MGNTRQVIATVMLLCLAYAMSAWDISENIASSFPKTAPVVNYLPQITLLLFIAFTIFNVCRMLLWAFAVFSSKRAKIERNLSCKPARRDELEAVLRLAESTINDDPTLPDVVSDIETTIKHYEHCRQSIHVIKDTKSGDIVGYFCILPLTKKGINLVCERVMKIEGGLSDMTNFCKNISKGTPIYIGGIAAHPSKKKRYGAATIHWLKKFIDKKGIEEAYARPATKDGVRIAKRNGFKPVNQDDKHEAGTYVRKLKNENPRLFKKRVNN